jgi:hypothetical protein
MICRLQRRPSLRRLWPLQAYLYISTIVQVIQTKMMHKLLSNELTDAQYSTVIIAEGIVSKE